MKLEGISGYKAEMIQQDVAVSMLKKSMDFQEQAVLKLIQGLPSIKDLESGKIIDTYV